MADAPDRPHEEVVPSLANGLLALCWIVLFAGRWIVVQLLLAAGLLSPTLVADLDDGVLMRCYLALLAVTIMVLVLAAMRAARSGYASPVPQGADQGAAQEQPQSV